MKTAVFGGTFDPVCNGHLGLAREVLRFGCADWILFVPAAVPPHKRTENITPFADRLAMVKLAVADEPGFLCSGLEGRRPGKSYTIDTLAELSKSGRYGKIALLIGSDSLRLLHTWRRAKELVRNYELIVYPRENAAATPEVLRGFWSEREIAQMLRSVLNSAPHFTSSATAIREKIKKDGPDGLTAFVRIPVANYIIAHHLYSS